MRRVGARAIDINVGRDKDAVSASGAPNEICLGPINGSPGPRAEFEQETW
jgi:hypothetical protein